MSQLDERPTFKFTRLGTTRTICKSTARPINSVNNKYTVLKDNEDLDIVAQKQYWDQLEWRTLANANMKTILEYGIEFPFSREIKIV